MTPGSLPGFPPGVVLNPAEDPIPVDKRERSPSELEGDFCCVPPGRNADRPDGRGEMGATGLVCRECGRRYALDPIFVCDACFGPACSHRLPRAGPV